MSTTVDTPRSPSILLINGREYMLYDEHVGRLKFADVKRLWLVAVATWVLVLHLTLSTAVVGNFRPSLAFVIPVILVLVASSITLFVIGIIALVSMATSPIFFAPVAAAEVARSGAWSTLAVTTRRHGVLTVMAHADMADFLVTEFAAGRGRSKPRTGAPSELTYPTMKRYVWGAYAAATVMVAVGIATAVQGIVFVLAIQSA